MRHAIVILSLLTVLLAVGCRKDQDAAAGAGSAAESGTAATKASGSAAAGGVKACDDYLAALDACVKKVPQAQKAGIETLIKTQRDALKGASAAGKEQQASGCTMGLATLKQSYPACK